MFAKNQHSPSMCFRSVVLLHSADEGSEKRVLRCACFSEIMRTLLIGRGASVTCWHAHKKELFRQVSFSRPSTVCYVLVCVCVSCVCHFAFLHVGRHLLLSKCTHKQILPYHCDIVSAKQNNLMRFFHCWCLSQSVFTQSGALLSPWCVWYIPSSVWMSWVTLVHVKWGAI